MVNLLEPSDKAGYIVVIGAHGNLGDGKGGGGEQELRLFHAQPRNGGIDVLSGVFLIKGGQAGIFLGETGEYTVQGIFLSVCSKRAKGGILYSKRD